MKPENEKLPGKDLPTTPPSVELLLEKIRLGQKPAVETLLDRHREPLRRMIGLRLDPAIAAREDASDIVQDVLLEAHKRIENYLKNPVMPFHLWLRHIAKDHIIDAHRRHRLAQRRSIDREQPLVRNGLTDQSSMEIARHLVDGGITPASEAVRKELAERVRSALDELELDDREIILMRGMEQMSNQEVAEVLNLTEAAASMRHLRALRKLKLVLAPETENG
jgi:RNA polymerase sigma-70 factor (ECF subfamily)